MAHPDELTDIDCAGAWGTCRESCDRQYIVAVAQSGNGKGCADAKGSLIQLDDSGFFGAAVSPCSVSQVDLAPHTPCRIPHSVRAAVRAAVAHTQGTI